MSDPIQEQVSILYSFLNELNGLSHIKKTKGLKEQVDTAIKALEMPDIENCINLINTFLTIDNKQVRNSCLKVLCELFTKKELDFYLSSNSCSQFLKNLFLVIEEPKSPHLHLACVCLENFMQSPNSQLYLHNYELQFFLERMFHCVDTLPNQENQKLLDALLRNYLKEIYEQITSKDEIDKVLLNDYKVIVSSLVKFALPTISEASQVMVTNYLKELVFYPPKSVVSTHIYKTALLVDIPQFFIQLAFVSAPKLYDTMLDLFKHFLEDESQIVPSIPAIIDQLISPAFEGNLAINAVSFLELIGAMERPVFLETFASCDCSSSDSMRVFERLVQAVTQSAMHNMGDRASFVSALRCIYSILASLQKFFLTAETAGDEAADDEREVLETKMTTEGCAALFNQNPKKGVASMIHSDLIPDDPIAIGEFLRKCALLEPSVVAEYLVRPENEAALRAHINTFDFKNCTLDQALRELCAQFSLPGESQQIDRVMVAFASKYHRDNETMSEDAAYVISFSIIMLHTDIFNPNVVHKITKEQWIRNTRHVKEACEVAIPVLEAIYDRVCQKPMRLKVFGECEGDALRKKSRKLLHKLMERSEQEAAPPLTRELLCLAIDRLWPTIFAVVSIGLPSCTDSLITDLNLKIAALLVFFLANFSMQKELESVISFLCQFCSTAPTPESQTAAISSVVQMAKDNGDVLGKSWHPILKLFSVISSWGSDMVAIDSSAPTAEIQKTFANHSQEIDSVYWCANQFSGFAFVSFMNELCDVSTEELCMNPPATFTLQKIIELMKTSFDRVRFIWSETWTIARAHFNRAACLCHDEISMYAIDGLRQIVAAGLSNAEKWQHFQADILVPFVTIFQNQTLLESRRFAVTCIDDLLREAEVGKGWDVLLDLYMAAAMDSNPSLISMTFNALTQYHARVPLVYATKLVNAFLIFAHQTALPDINVKAIEVAAIAAERIENPSAEILSEIAVLFDETNPLVWGTASDMYFMLVTRYKDSDTASAVFEFVMPIFASPSAELHSVLTRSLCSVYLPKTAEESVPLVVPWAVRTMIEYSDSAALGILLAGLLALIPAGGDDLKERYVTNIISILNDGPNPSHLVLAAMKAFHETEPPGPIATAAALRAVDVGDLALVGEALGYVFRIHASGDIENGALADVVLAVLKLLSTKKGSEAVDVMRFICPMGVSFFKGRVHDLQEVLFEFFTCENSDIRAFAKELAIASLSI